MEQIFSWYVSGDENNGSRVPVVNDVTVLFSRIGPETLKEDPDKK